jgi:ubiquinol-cytochrome c reductase cytochrome b subunit
MIALHDTAGSGNPLGLSGNYDRVPMSPYFLEITSQKVS